MSQEQEQAFLSAICEQPDDDTPRLVFADWLQERDGPGDADRAEFIRLQCQLARMPANELRWLKERRARELLAKHVNAWTAPLDIRGALSVEFRRGFPYHIVISARRFLDYDNAALLFNCAPVRSVLITDLSGDVQRLANSPHLRNLAELSLACNRIGDDGAVALANSSHLANLIKLSLQYCGLGSWGAEALAKSPRFRNLVTLNLCGNGIGNGGARVLADSPIMQRLTHLNLCGNDISNRGATVLANSPYLANLVGLNLCGNRIDNEGVRALLDSTTLQRVTDLDLDHNLIAQEVLEEIKEVTNQRREKGTGRA